MDAGHVAIQKISRPRGGSGVFYIKSWWLDINPVNKVKAVYYRDKIIIYPLYADDVTEEDMRDAEKALEDIRAGRVKPIPADEFIKMVEEDGDD